MGVLTPITGSKILLSRGSRDSVLAKFTTITDGDTWVTGLGKVEMVLATAGASGFTIGATYSGGTVTFAIGSGPATNVMVEAIGPG
ncbi:MAG: hypothetical protein HQL37_11380 [Alphaproteobacteria bacterium]|nr:hypothetical protein [Alphaproteobacteria bacterium]